MSCCSVMRLGRRAPPGRSASSSSSRTVTIRAAFSPSGAAGRASSPLAPSRVLLAAAIAALAPTTAISSSDGLAERGQVSPALHQRRQIQVGLRPARRGDGRSGWRRPCGPAACIWSLKPASAAIATSRSRRSPRPSASALDLAERLLVGLAGEAGLEHLERRAQPAGGDAHVVDAARYRRCREPRAACSVSSAARTEITIAAASP